jgi:hypothetical protein
MADKEVLAYRPFRKTDDSSILYWRAYRSEEQGGFAGTSVVVATVGVFTAPTEERLKEMAKELGYGLRRVAEPERPSDTRAGVEPGSPALDPRQPQ